MIVKLLNDETPNDVGAANLATTFGSTGANAIENAGAGFVVGVDDGIDPPTPGQFLPDPGAYSEIRLLGIPGNQTTGQQRVPVIITSLRDDTVGTTVRGVKMFDIANSIPVYTTIINPGASLDTPAAGDGGYIYIGGQSLTEYDPTNPFDGSVISNADISYMSRIEVQGGGIIDSTNNFTGKPGAPSLTTTDWLDTLTGYQLPVNQINQSMMFTIADSNLSDFSDAAVFAHPEALNALYRDWTGLVNNEIPPFPTRGGLVGEPVDLYMFNDTISNSGQGVHINSTTGDDTTGNTAFQAVLLNNTFFNDGVAVQTISPQFDGKNEEASVGILMMNNIFDGSSSIGIDLQGQYGGSDIQYNLFFGNLTNIVETSTDGVTGNIGPVFADPQFVGPVGTGDASAQNFELQPTSPAINSARSEIGPSAGGDMIYPTVDLVLNGGVVNGIRTNPDSLFFPQEPGRSDVFGGFRRASGSQANRHLTGFGLLLLPRRVAAGPPDRPQQFLECVPGPRYLQLRTGRRPARHSGSHPGPASRYAARNRLRQQPVHGHRCLPVRQSPSARSNRRHRDADPGSRAGQLLHPRPALGSKPDAVDVNITFNGPISPGTLTANTVTLVDLGSNPSQPLNQAINLAGKLSYDSATDTLIINLGAAGLTLGTDLYQITLFGSGSPVITNQQGVALDGENTVGGTSTGAQLALPSGNGYPGGNFFTTFFINTTPPSVAAGSLVMAPASDTNIVGDNVTSSAQPTFNGTIDEPNPTLVDPAGQTAILDVGIALLVNGVLTTFFDPSQVPSADAQFVRQDAGTAKSTSGGTFAVTVGVDGANTGLVTNQTPLPDLTGTYNVGPDGLLVPLPGDDSGYYVARVRIIDQSGNQSNPNDPNAQVPFVVDKTDPTLTVTSPTSGQVITSLTNGQIAFSVTTSQNIDQTHFSASSIELISAGPDGILDDADDVVIPIDPNSIKFTLLDTGTGGPVPSRSRSLRPAPLPTTSTRWSS